MHFAPEPAIRTYLLDKTRHYVSADLAPGRADREEDIENLSFPDSSFDLVVCSHLFEHVDDRKAIAEVFRVLAPGGRLVSMVPIIEGWENTYEPPIENPEHRALHFGQFNHRRLYGRDYERRLENAGFRTTSHVAEGADCVFYGLMRGDRVFLSIKPRAS